MVYPPSGAPIINHDHTAKVALIYRGVTAPSLLHHTGPDPMWLDTSGPVPVLKMRNATDTAWIAVDADSNFAGVTATSGEVNILRGATITTAEINVLDGVTATSGQINRTIALDSAMSSVPSGAVRTFASGGLTQAEADDLNDYFKGFQNTLLGRNQ